MTKFSPLLKLRFPEYPIKIRLVTQAQMDRYAEAPRREGLWDVDLKTVYILRTLAPHKILDVFFHEADHAFADWKQWWSGLRDAELEKFIEAAKQTAKEEE